MWEIDRKVLGGREQFGLNERIILNRILHNTVSVQSFNYSEYAYILTPDEDSTMLVYDAMSINEYHSSDSLRITLDYNEDRTS